MIYYLKIHEYYVKIKIEHKGYLTSLGDHWECNDIMRMSSLIVNENFKVIKSRVAFNDETKLIEVSKLIKEFYYNRMIDLTDLSDVSHINVALQTLKKAYRTSPEYLNKADIFIGISG